ncbi:MAG: bifunctional [glutamine synthetase] adenylyltransferase/[glutamine synthetase]-adenylyl-L-tyrosine phosphorylase, partial [Hyphomicrobiales bacterium]|nr:bifunctional [glutamine synthetase] adenylyltransferase/[glutamine synthetase]-adenylyl-L-tyrosine phosphorylase [Hyphomicrobiales bacterium]
MLASLVGKYRKLGELLAGIAETAPYLWELIEADPSRALRYFTGDPEQSLAQILRSARHTARSARAPAKISRVLRRAKADAALLIALADLGGVWSVAQVTDALTQIADVTLGLAIQHLLGEAAARKRFLPVDSRDPAAGSGYVVLAMGKLGAGELNFSSDIDLMVFF